MRKRAGLAIVSLCVVATATQVAGLKPDATADRVWEGDNGLKVEGLGVCSIEPSNVDCWDMDGVHDASLSEQIRGYYMGSSNEVSFRVGKKNRYLVYRKSYNANIQAQSPDGQYMNSSEIYGSGGPTVSWSRINPDTASKDASILFSINGLPGPKPVTVPFEKGKKGTFEGTELEIGEYKPFKPAPGEQQQQPYYPMIANAKQWSIFVGFAPSDQQNSLSYGLLGKDGKPVAYVDRDGEPVSAVKFLSETPPGFNGYYNGYNPGYDFGPGGRNTPPKYAAAVVTSNGPSVQGAFTLRTNVNPSRIGALTVSATHQMRVLVKGFPLDPKP